MRDAYIDAFTSGINVASVISEINLRNIGLTTNWALKILENLKREKILSLDLSNNPNISKQFYEALAEYLDDPCTNLRKLVLEGNKFGDSNL